MSKIVTICFDENGVSVTEKESIKKVELYSHDFYEEENHYTVKVTWLYGITDYQVIDRKSEFRVSGSFDSIVSRYIGIRKEKIIALKKNEDGTIDPTSYPRRSNELIEVIDILAGMLPMYADVWELIKTKSKVDTVEEPHKPGDRFFTVKEAPDVDKLVEEVEALKKRVNELERRG